MEFRGDLKATEQLDNDSVCMVENGEVRRVYFDDIHVNNLVYVENWQKIDGNNEVIEAGEYVRYRPYKKC